MGFYIRRGESVRRAIRRIAAEQLTDAITQIRDRSQDRHEVVHNLRKTCKRMRGLVRLVRVHLQADYRAENAFYRQLSREFSDLRDAQALVEAIERLEDVNQQARLGDPNDLAIIKSLLLERREEATGVEADLQARLEQAVPRIERARDRAMSWKIPRGEFSVVRPGLLAIYERARQDMPCAYASGTNTAFHEWRKAVKYHWYHAELLQKMAPTLLDGHRGLVDRLGETLGQDHDYSVLLETVALRCASAAIDLPQRALRLLEQVIGYQQCRLRREAWRNGALLFAEKPKAIGKRWGAYWNAWRSQPPRLRPSTSRRGGTQQVERLLHGTAKRARVADDLPTDQASHDP